jgi:CRISP-associated protein Cas1
MSSYYFKQKFADYEWIGRFPRQKPDYINYLLDIGYTYLFNFSIPFIQTKGFDICVGFLHSDYYNRPSLACDIIEPLRYPIDDIVIKSINLKLISNQDFEVIDGKVVCICRSNLNKYIELISTNMTTKFQTQLEKEINTFSTYVLDYNL